MISAEITGMDRLTRKLQSMPPESTREVKKAIAQSAFLVEMTAKKAIAHGKKSGKVYKRRGIFHRASAAGEAPATDTGRLISTITHQALLDGLEMIVGTALKYGAYLEFGTHRIAARPWLAPSLRQNSRKIVKLIDEAVRKTIQKKIG